MTVIITDGELTEKRKNNCCKYYQLFRLINRISKIIEKLEENTYEYEYEESVRAEIVY